jgi:hypothetical protein
MLTYGHITFGESDNHVNNFLTETRTYQQCAYYEMKKKPNFKK